MVLLSVSFKKQNARLDVDCGQIRPSDWLGRRWRGEFREGRGGTRKAKFFLKETMSREPGNRGKGK